MRPRLLRFSHYPLPTNGERGWNRIDNIIPTAKTLMNIINAPIPKSKPVFRSSCGAVRFVTNLPLSITLTSIILVDRCGSCTSSRPHVFPCMCTHCVANWTKAHEMEPPEKFQWAPLKCGTIWQFSSESDSSTMKYLTSSSTNMFRTALHCIT